MALLTNYPIALAPGMGINAFFTFTICGTRGVPWPEALGMVFINGVIFLALTLTGVREKIIAAIPHSLKIAVTCGIGLFIAFIGLKNGGIIVANPATFVSHGNFASGPVALCLAGIALTAVLVARRVPGAIVISIALVTGAGLRSRGRRQHGHATARKLCGSPASPASAFLKLTFRFLTSTNAILLACRDSHAAARRSSTTSALIGVTKRAGFLRRRRRRRARLCNRLAGDDSERAERHVDRRHIESAAGVEAGGRTGLTIRPPRLMLALFSRR